ncbi:MAG TPA: GNAT family N-acetyltransferase [Herpetosiphonaceae bacterium]
MKLREYTSEDKAACLAIFDSNTPDYFAPHERSDYVGFLDQPEQYFVIETDAARIVACGGIFCIPRTDIGILSWDMVARDQHRQGIGRALMFTRLQLLCQNPMIAVVKIQTSQHAAPFYETAGFITEEITEHAFAANLHRYDMVLHFTPAQRQAIAEHATAARALFTEA